MSIVNKLLTIFNLLPALCCGQQIIWDNHYGGESYEYIAQGWPLNSEIIRTPVGNYIFSSVTNSFNVYSNQYVITVNSEGNLINQFNVGSPIEADNSFATIKTWDNNYFVAGNANMQFVNPNDIRLTKFSQEGDLIFSKIIIADSSYQAKAHDICYTKDSNYIAACETYNNIFLVKFNSNGDKLWVKRPLPDSLGSGVPLCFQPAPAYSAYYGVSVHNNYDYYWFKTDTAGQLIDLKKIENPGQYWVQVKKAVMLPNGNILIYGGGQSPDGSELCPNLNPFYDFLFEYNSEGEVIRQQILCEPQLEGDPPYIRNFYEFMVADDSSIYFIFNKFLYKINSNWEYEWSYTIDIPVNAELMKLSQFEYGYLIAAGQIQLSPDDIDIFMCKIALPEAIGIEEKKGSDFKVYPNPASDILTIEAPDNIKAEYFIYDVSGRLLGQWSMVNGKSVIDVSSFAEGVYIIELQTEQGLARKKFVKHQH